MPDMKNSRRTFLAFGAASTLAGLYVAYLWRWGNPTDVVISILERRVGYLKVERDTFRQFAQDYVVSRKQHSRMLGLLSAFSMPLRFFSPYDWLQQNHGFQRIEDSVVSLYLLSTDFFQNGASEERPVTYLSFYDPFVTVCRNPFNRRT
jgi:hypothetical protein